MTEDEVMNLIREAIASVAPEHANLNLEMNSTLGELGISSITALEIAGYIEEKLDIRLPDDELAPLNTIGGLVQLIRRHA